MSVFKNIFKMKKIDENEEKMNLLVQVTNGKLSQKEVLKIYQTLNEQVIKKMPRNVQIVEAMDLLTSLKGEWLSTEEKENFVACAWMYDTLMVSPNSNKSYINSEQLKYVKQAVLGSQFKAARDGKYYADLKDNEYKY